MKKLHLGCGNKILKGWINIDILPIECGEEEKCIVHDIVFMKDLFDDESIDEIYACHVLDHLSRNKELDKALAEWNRILRPGGILRVAVSDFEKVVKMYNEGLDLERLWGFIVGGHKNEYDKHGCVFDFNTLRRYLEKHGFVNVRRYRWQDFLPEGFEDNSCATIPKWDLNGYLMSLNVVCNKKEEK